MALTTLSGGEPPFANHVHLYNTIDAIPIGGVPWQKFTVLYNASGNLVITEMYLTCLKRLRYLNLSNLTNLSKSQYALNSLNIRKFPEFQASRLLISLRCPV